ncbi:MAG: glycosyl transferase family 2, partial [Mesorhizobium sp.]
MAEHPIYSIVMEMENAKSIDWNEIGLGLKSLAREIAAVPATGFARPKVAVSHGGPDSDGSLLQASIEAEAPELMQVADLTITACPDGRYYELKNNGVLLTEGDIVVFLDSDTVPQ